MNQEIDPNLDELLRDHYEAPVADEGFSSRLMQTIPQKRPRISRHFLISFLLGMAALLWQTSSSTLFHNAWKDLAQGHLTTSVWLLYGMFASVSLFVSSWLLTESE
jgi:hypothetical protein